MSGLALPVMCYHSCPLAGFLHINGPTGMAALALPVMCHHFWPFACLVASQELHGY
jgi:hypothetical protein